jgi:ABC-2 type transport system ATP-binding protein
VAIIDHGRVLRSGTIAEIERSLRTGAVLRIDLLGDAESIESATAWLGNDPRVSDVLPAETAARDEVTSLEVAFDGPPDAQAAFLRDMIDAGHRVVGFRQATTDLEEIFLQVTGQHAEEAVA